MTDTFEVVVGNVGTVISTTDGGQAKDVYQDYVALSKCGVGRAGGENVTLAREGEIVQEYEGHGRDTWAGFLVEFRAMLDKLPAYEKADAVKALERWESDPTVESSMGDGFPEYIDLKELLDTITQSLAGYPTMPVDQQ